MASDREVYCQPENDDDGSGTTKALEHLSRYVESTCEQLKQLSSSHSGARRRLKGSKKLLVDAEELQKLQDHSITTTGLPKLEPPTNEPPASGRAPTPRKRLILILDGECKDLLVNWNHSDCIDAVDFERQATSDSSWLTDEQLAAKLDGEDEKSTEELEEDVFDELPCWSELMSLQLDVTDEFDDVDVEQLVKLFGDYAIPNDIDCRSKRKGILDTPPPTGRTPLSSFYSSSHLSEHAVDISSQHAGLTSLDYCSTWQCRPVDKDVGRVQPRPDPLPGWLPRRWSDPGTTAASLGFDRQQSTRTGQSAAAAVSQLWWLNRRRRPARCVNLPGPHIKDCGSVDKSALWGKLLDDKLHLRQLYPSHRTCHLWEFMLHLLTSTRGLVTWEDRQRGVFRIMDSKRVATLWGQHKRNPGMTYEKLSRALRWCRTYGFLEKLPEEGCYPKKLCFRFGPRATNWRQRAFCRYAEY